MSLWVKNTFAGTIETYYKPVPPTNLAGELVVPARLSLPPLPLGRAVNLNVPFGGIKPYLFSTTEGGRAAHNGWCALYNGGDGSLLASMTCHAADGTAVRCAVAGERRVQLPNDAMCAL